jgi:hypothetical protein
MTEATTSAAPAASERTDISVIQAPADAPEAMSVTQAARMLSALSRQKEEAPAAPEGAARETTQESEVKAEDVAPPETEAPGETQTEESAEPAEELPPIEPPRSWSKDEKERFQSLPRETQAYLAERETERDREIRRAQNEAAEKLKGLTAKEQAVEQARQHYEAALPQLLQSLQNQQLGEFSDIKTIADVEKLAREDWPRYLQWDVAQKKLAAVKQEMLAAQQRQATEKQQRFAEFATRKDDLFKERVPEMADSAKAAKLQSSAMNVLKDLGFEEAELAASWNGEKELSLRDHRLQLLIRDATLWREAQTKAVTAAKKPVPPVQRPGAATVKNAGREAELQNLSKQLDANPSGRNAAMIAARLVAARRAAAR